LTFKNTRAAIEFYTRAFGANEIMTFPSPNGGIMHAEIRIGNSIIMAADEMPEMNHLSAESLQNSPASLYLYVENVDAVFERATQAGAKVVMPIGEMFWGDRCGTVLDPFNYKWMIATHTRDLSPEEIRKGGEAFMASMAAGKA